MLRSPPAYDSQPDSVGYPAIVAEMAEKGLLKVGARQAAGSPGRVVFDEARRDGFVAQYAEQGGGTGIGSCRQVPGIFFGLVYAVFGESDPSSEECRELFQTFRRKSFLRDDMRVDSERVWRQEDGQLVGLAPGAHVIADATRGFATWQGTVAFATPYKSVMLVDAASRNTHIQFDPRAARDVEYMPGEGGAGERAGIVAASAIIRTNGQNCQGNARVSLLGDKVLLTLLPTSRSADCAEIRIDSTPVISSEFGNGGYDFRLLDTGQLLTFAGDEPVVMQLVESVGGLSAMDDRVRRNEPSLASIGRAIALAGPYSDRYRTAIRPQLHFRSQSLLERLATRELAGERSSFRAGAIMLDAMTGEVVAAPTFPLRKEHLVAADRSQPNRLDWLSQNQNLVPIPVGSTAKVPLATAIVEAYPDLLTLKTPGQAPEFSAVLGDRLSSSGIALEDNRSGTVDFPTFIAQSSNYYAVLLMRLAAGPDPLASNGYAVPASQRYTVSGRLRARAPARPGAGEPWGYGWYENLWRIACLPPYPKGRNNIAAWWSEDEQGCPRYYLSRESVQNPVLLGAIAHSAPRLDFPDVEQASVYPDYYMSILGQNRGSWSTAALAQAYARIITDRRVALRFDAATRRDAPFDRLGLNSPVWTNVSEGMRRAVTEGTATRLGNGLGSAFDGIAVYAKTGTPTLDYRVPGQGESVEQGHSIVVAFIRYSRTEQVPGNMCSARIIAVNIEDRDGAEKAPALDLVLQMARQGPIQRWLTEPCATPAAQLPDGAVQ